MRITTAAYLGINLVGMVIIARVVFGIEALAHLEQRDYRDASDSVTFLATAAPVVLICAACALFWCVKAVIEISRRKDFESLKAFVATLTAWIAFPLTLRLFV